MTDTLGIMGDESPPLDFPDEPEVQLSEKWCVNHDTCGGFLPVDSHHNRKYCDACQPADSKKNKKKKDSTPRVVIDMGSPKPARGSSKDKLARDVEDGANRYIGLIITGLFISGNSIDAELWQIHGPQLATQIGNLARFHPAIAKVFVAAGGDSEATAWLGLAMAGLPIALGMADNHGKLPAKLKGLMAAGAAVAATQEATVADPAA